ncbi:MAG: hypothetical protein LBO79_06005, partial [Zoogloeaceae bacterium]|nr:hypothetical protein [Zoogloeaceae bacterium]
MRALPDDARTRLSGQGKRTMFPFFTDRLSWCRATLIVYGGDRPVAALRASVPGLKAMSRASLKGCLLR